jgi:uncharacterized protein YcfL
MKSTWTIIAVLAAVLVAGCAAKKGFEKPGFAYGCPIGDTKIGTIEDLVKAKVVTEGKRTTIQATEMRCTMTGDLLKIDVNLNNDSSHVKRINYKFRWIDREGMRAWEEEVWKPLLMNESTNIVITGIAPTSKAVDYRLILQSQE